jgi:hypothetical protein
MPVYKAKDLKAERSPYCGCITTHYPLKPENDLLDWIIVRRTLDMEEEWSMQKHKHKYFEEYWFVLEGSGKFYIGDEEFDVGVGDLVVTPRDVPHKAKGDITFACCMAKHNVFGQTLGTKMPYEAVEKPYRKDPEATAEVGRYVEREMCDH